MNSSDATPRATASDTPRLAPRSLSALPTQADAVVVGAGILGLATAAELLTRLPGWRVAVVEKEAAPALHQTGRNSCVIHSGVYYLPGSLKARLCRRGYELLLEFCDRHDVAYEICGKVIVAAGEHERNRLEELYRRGTANGVPGIRLIGAGELREREPHCVGVGALHLPSTGIVDFRLVARALERRFRELGGEVHVGAEVTGISETARRVRVSTRRGTIEASLVITCAGLQADRVASGQERAAVDRTAILPFRGDYFALRPAARQLCRNLIYPVPDPRFPFLGVHLNRRPDGEVWVGPNAVVALARERYRRRDVDLRDALATLGSRAFWRLARRYWRLGLAEVYRDVVPGAFVAAIRRYVPELTRGDVVPAPAGIRAQAIAADGTLVDDFLFVEGLRVLHVKNAPSPGATSSLAIAESIVDRALALFGVAPRRTA